MAALLTLPEAEAARRKNSLFSVASLTVSQCDMLDTVHRLIRTTDADWIIKYEPCRQRYKDGVLELNNGIRTGHANAMYTRVFFRNGGGDFESCRELANHRPAQGAGRGDEKGS